MSRSIDPRRPYRLEDSSYINDIPCVRTLEEKKQARKQARDVKKRTYENTQAASQRDFGDNPLCFAISERVTSSGNLRNVWRSYARSTIAQQSSMITQ